MVKSQNFRAIFGIAATFIGTVVGAGFASGQEIYQFFTVYGCYGSAGLILATLILATAANRIFKIGLRLQTHSYRDILQHLLGPALVPVADFFLLLFYLLLIGVMFAGSGSVFREINLDYGWGIVLTLLILIGVLYRGLPGLVKVNVLVIPLMFGACSVVAAYALFSRCNVVIPSVSSVNWILAALQFSSYNLILAVPVLLALAKDYPDSRLLGLGSWLGSIALGILAFLIHASISCHNRLQDCALPMVYFARKIGGWFFWGYAFILWGEMLTTLLANVYGLGQRLAVLTGWALKWWVAVLGITGIGIAKFGFVKLIAAFYPLYGYLSMILLILIFLKPR